MGTRDTTAGGERKGIWAYKHSDMGREKMGKMMENMQVMG